MPKVWCQLTGIEIIDADGWNRQDFDADWRKPLNFKEFIEKVHKSTTTLSHYSDAQLKVMAIARLFLLCEND